MMKINLIVAITCVLCASGLLRAEFTDPVKVSIEDADYEAPDITLDTVDNVAIVSNSGDRVYFTSTTLGLGTDEIALTDASDDVVGARIAACELGLLYVIYGRESSAAGTVGNDIILDDNAGGLFENIEELADSDEDESDPEIAIRFANVHAVWTLIPDGSEPEIYYSYDEGAGVLVETGKEPKVAADSDGHGHIIYQRGGDVYYREYDTDLEVLGAEENLSELVGTESNYEIAAASDDTIHVVFLNGDALYHTENSSGEFVAAEEINSGPIEEVAIAAGPDGEVAIVHVDGDGLVQFAELTETGFADPTEVVSTLDASEPSVSYDSEGYLHVVYVEDDAVHYTNAVPTADVDFSADVTSGEAPVTVQFTNLTEGVVSEYLWDFGDGNTSTEAEPIHTYQTLGNHTVRLTATGPGGATSRTRLGLVRVTAPTNIFRIPEISVFPGQSVVHPVYGTTTNDIQGFTLILGYDDAYISIDEISLTDTATDTVDPEFVEISDNPDGADSTVRIAIIFDFETPLDGRVIEAGDDLFLTGVEYVVPSDVLVGDSTTLEFVNEDEFNVFSASTEDGVFSVIAAHVNGGYEVTTLDTDGAFIRGDVTNDGSLTLTDAIRVLLWMFEDGDEPECLDACDFDDNEVVSLIDVIGLMRFMFQRGVPPAYPYPAPGIDSGGDTLDCAF